MRTTRVAVGTTTAETVAISPRVVEHAPVTTLAIEETSSAELSLRARKNRLGLIPLADSTSLPLSGEAPGMTGVNGVGEEPLIEAPGFLRGPKSVGEAGNAGTASLATDSRSGGSGECSDARGGEIRSLCRTRHLTLSRLMKRSMSFAQEQEEIHHPANRSFCPRS